MADVTALAVPTERLSPLRRLDLADYLIDLAGAACLLGHPAAPRLARLKTSHFYEARTDAVLLRAVDRLAAFVAECAARGNLLPAYHPCYVAPPALTGAV